VNLIIIAALLIMGAIGFYFGHVWTVDRAEAMRDQARATLAVARGIPDTWTREWRARPPTGELTALYEGTNTP
jgi:hypothetical protein